MSSSLQNYTMNGDSFDFCNRIYLTLLTELKNFVVFSNSTNDCKTETDNKQI